MAEAADGLEALQGGDGAFVEGDAVERELHAGDGRPVEAPEEEGGDGVVEMEDMRCLASTLGGAEAHGRMGLLDTEGQVLHGPPAARGFQDVLVAVQGRQGLHPIGRGEADDHLDVVERERPDRQEGVGVERGQGERHEQRVVRAGHLPPVESCDRRHERAKGHTRGSFGVVNAPDRVVTSPAVDPLPPDLHADAPQDPRDAETVRVVQHEVHVAHEVRPVLQHELDLFRILPDPVQDRRQLAVHDLVMFPQKQLLRIPDNHCIEDDRIGHRPQ